MKAAAPRASEALGACEPHRGRVHPRPGPVQRRGAACERQFRHVRAAAWRVSAAPCPVRAGRFRVPAAPWRVRVLPWAVSIAPWACVRRGLGACEMTLGACQSSLGACQERLNGSTLRQLQGRCRLAPKGAGDSRHRAPGARARQGAFPDPQDCPARRTQGARHGAVARRVPGEFRRPIPDMRSRHTPVTRASVPKATVHKHRDLMRAENEIRLARQRRSAPPAGDAMLTEQRNQAKLGALVVLAAHARHKPRASRTGVDVGHEARRTM